MSDTYDPSIAWRIFRNPIVRRELSVAGRSMKTVVALSLAMLIQCMVLAIILYVNLDSDFHFKDPDELGNYLLQGEMTCLVILTVVIFPAFSCSAISSERASGSLELLKLTPLATWELIWGKIVASMALSLIYVVSALPFLMVAFAFPTIPLRTVFLAFCWILVMSILITAAGIYSSVVFKRPIASMIATYVSAILLGFLSILVIGAVIADSYFAGGVIAAFLGDLPEHTVGFSVIATIICTCLYFTLFFLLTVARMKESSENRASALRYFSFLSTIIFLALLIGAYVALDGLGYTVSSVVADVITTLAALAIVGVVIKAAGSSAFAPRQIRRSFRQKVDKNPLWKLLWITMPGSGRAWICGMLLASVALIGAGVFGTAMTQRAAETESNFVANELPRYANYDLRNQRLEEVEISSSGPGATLPNKNLIPAPAYARDAKGIMLGISQALQNDPQKGELFEQAREAIVEADMAVTWHAIVTVLFAIFGFGALAWWVSLASRKDNLGSGIGIAGLVAIIVTPPILLGVFAGPGNAERDFYGSFSPVTAPAAYNNSVATRRAEILLKLGEDAGIAKQEIAVLERNVQSASRREHYHYGFFYIVGILGLVSLALGMIEYRKCRVDIEKANGRWPPPKLPLPRDFTQSGQTGLERDGAIHTDGPDLDADLPPSTQASDFAPSAPPPALPPSLPPSED